MRKDKAKTRTCILTGKETLPERGIRFVLGPGNQVTPDIANKLPGAAVWLSCQVDMVREAIEKKQFDGAFGTVVKVEPDLPSNIRLQLRASALAMVSMAKKAGCAVAGLSKVDSALKSSDVSILLHAADAAPDGVEKLNRLMAAVQNADGLSGMTCTLFDSIELDNALGGTNTKHVAVLESGVAKALKTCLGKLETYG